jgi:UDP-N-acetylglucosamine 4,6-dehydratase|tara:strand:+ start:709 stop:1554 length:846 start_codon:yes stop_codon:yes gene_type:complete
MSQQFNDQDYPAIRYFIGDVRDRDRLELAMRDVDMVVHTAAMKHVPLAEYNPTECIHTNILGAENVVRAALHCGVEKVIALSTDKAVNPVNLYGASKLASDKIFVAANNLSGKDGPRFSVVRYGNVVGSKGSVIPFFQSLIDKGADSLLITDARMTRFWITLQQGVDFVLSSFWRMEGGEIFVPKLPSMGIVEVARCLAPDLPHKVMGIRAGEKLHEILVTSEDAQHTIELTDRYIVLPPHAFWEERDYPVTAPLVSQDFQYTSDKNPEWLTDDNLREMLR